MIGNNDNNDNDNNDNNDNDNNDNVNCSYVANSIPLHVSF